LKLAALVEDVLLGLPDLSLARAYEVAEALGRGEEAFSTFMDLLRQAIAQAVRSHLSGESDSRQDRLVSLLSLDAWGETWHALSRLQHETERFNLDTRQAVVAALGRLCGTG
jgi:DNA polymerase-3 subunit delta'